jgi:anti-sigma factor RsiW
MPRDLTCRELIEFLLAWREGELPEAERRAFDQHLALCPDCAEYLRSYEETVRLGRAAFRQEGDPVPEDVPEELVDAIVALRSARRLP